MFIHFSAVIQYSHSDYPRQISVALGLLVSEIVVPTTFDYYGIIERRFLHVNVVYDTSLIRIFIFKVLTGKQDDDFVKSLLIKNLSHIILYLKKFDNIFVIIIIFVCRLPA